MGCGGSKQQDVATGNTVSTGKLSLKESATTTTTTTKSDASSAAADVGIAEGSLKPVVEKAEIASANGSSKASEKPTTTTTTTVVSEVTGEAHLLTNETANEYLSPRKDAEMVEEDGGSEGVDHLSPRKDYDANVVGVDGVEELRESETKAQEDGKGEVGLKIDGDGDSIGKHSNDFKEALSIEETDEGKMDIAEKKNVGEGEIVNGSSDQ